jgi:hypothetical protein
VVRRFMLATFVALSAVLLTAPIALAQYGDDSGGSGSESTTGGSTAESSSSGGSCSGKPASGSVVINAATMTGEVETPAGDPDGTGQATFWLKDDKVWFKSDWTGIDKPNLAHIHKGAAGAAGDPVVTIFDGAPAREGCVVADAAVVKRISENPGNYYFNIHNEKFPKGAVRDQFAAGSPTLPFTGDTSDRLLWLGSIVTLAGMLLVYTSRRYGLQVGRHLAGAAGRGGRTARASERPW